MWQGKKVSVVFPTYREKSSIRSVLAEFWKNGYVDEIVVVNNNAEEGTDREVKKTKARLIYEYRQGYGHAIRAGLAAAKGDLLIVAEPDGSFDGRDVVKLLAYSDDFETVFGSRTHVPFIHKGSDMTFIKRIGDVMLGKLVTLLFLCNPLTDLGCTLRITTRKGWEKVRREVKAGDGIFATEWVLVAAKNNVKFTEIPINFQSRIGESTLSGTNLKRIWWGVRKFIYVWKIWLISLALVPRV
jgi:glycosyltransferase involved in cell wall biosynthesis